MNDPIELPICLSPGATLPTYKTAGAAGMDLCCSEDVDLGPLERKLVPTGLRIAIPEGYEGQVRPRSGLAIHHGIALVNSPGTIDCDYRGEIKLIMINLGETVVHFTRGDRIGQLVVCPVVRVGLIEVDSLETTERGEGGFGSTGAG